MIMKIKKKLKINYNETDVSFVENRYNNLFYLNQFDYSILNLNFVYIIIIVLWKKIILVLHVFIFLVL